MSEKENQLAHAGFPWKQVIGLLLSLALTFLALWVATGLSLPVQLTLAIIVGLAIVQALIQLFMFMHFTEGTEPVHQMLGIAFGVFVTVVIVAFTIWILYYEI